MKTKKRPRHVEDAVRALLPRKKKPKTELDLRLDAEEARNAPVNRLCPGYYGVGFLMPTASRIVGGTSHAVVRNEDLEVVMWDVAPLGHRRYSSDRVAKLLCVTKPHFRYGVPTIEAGYGSTVCEFASKREHIDELNLRYWRMGIALQETCQSAGRRHARSVERKLEGRKDLAPHAREVRYGGEWHNSLPYAMDIFPDALIGTNLTVTELWQLCGQSPRFGFKVGQFMLKRRFVTPVGGVYVGDERVILRQHESCVRELKRSLKNLDYKEVIGHYIRDQHGRMHEFLIPRSAEIKFKPGQEVSLGDTFGRLPEPPKPPRPLDVEPTELGCESYVEPVEIRLYDKARRNIPANIMDAVEQLMIQCDLQHLYHDDAEGQKVHVTVLDWDKYQDVIVLNPDQFSLYGWDLHKANAFYDDGCEGVGVAIHRPYFPESEDRIRGMRIILPSTRDPLVSITRLSPHKERSAPVTKVRARSRKERARPLPQAKPGVDVTAATHHIHFLKVMNVQAEIIAEERARLFVVPEPAPVAEVPVAAPAPAVEEVPVVIRHVVLDTKPAITKSSARSKPTTPPVSAGQKLLKLLRR